MQRISRAVRVSAFLLASALGAGAATAGEEVYFKITLTDARVAAGTHSAGTGEQIEIQSFHWGPRQSTSVASGDMTLKGSKINENAPASRPGTAIGGAIGGWANDGDEAAGAPRGTGSNQMSMDDTAGKEKARRGTRTVDANETITVDGGRTEGDPDRPIVAGSLPNPSASKRQHGAVTISKEWGAASPQLAKPQDQGSVWIRVATPWTACRAGTRYPAIELGDGKASYQLSDVVVTSCAAGGASLSYAKVKVRAWDPERKE